MATYDATLHVEAFENMERGHKTVYAVPATDEYSMMCMGDRLEFGSHGSITIGMVRRYTSLDHLCEVEGWQNIVPEANNAADAIDRIRKGEGWNAEVEVKNGVMALRVRDAKRK